MWLSFDVVHAMYGVITFGLVWTTGSVYSALLGVLVLIRVVCIVIV